MSSVLIPKEQQTAYERWEMSSFSPEGHVHTAPKREQPTPEVAEKLAQITENARKEGFTQGLKEGYEAGLQQALELSEADKAALFSLTDAFNQSLQKSEEDIAKHLLVLAMDLAKAMLKTQIAVDQDAILPIVREAIQSLPYVQKPAKIMLHPQDAATVRTYMAEELNAQWHIVEDHGMERGGCLLETGANQIDATNATRWKRIAEALGQNDHWQEEPLLGMRHG